MAKEQEFSYTRSNGPGGTQHITKKESELTSEEVNLFYGDLVSRWNNSPKIARDKFIDALVRKGMEESPNQFKL